MFRHIAMFRWTADATYESKTSVATELAKLPAAIDSIRHFTFGSDCGLAEGNWDFAVVADFADVGGYLAYRDDETHQELIARWIRPIVAERAAMQFDLPL